MSFLGLFTNIDLKLMSLLLALRDGWHPETFSLEENPEVIFEKGGGEFSNMIDCLCFKIC